MIVVDSQDLVYNFNPEFSTYHGDSMVHKDIALLMVYLRYQVLPAAQLED